MKTLFLNPPSYEGFDGGAGSRYQARREVRSYWYPTWLAQPAALVPGSKLIDAPPDGLTLDDIRPLAREYELAVLHTSTPSFPHDVKAASVTCGAARGAGGIRRRPHHGAAGGDAARRPWPSTSVTTGEFDYAVRDRRRRRLRRRARHRLSHGRRPDHPTAAQPPITDLDAFPYVVDVYNRHLTIENYYIGYLQHPTSRCTRAAAAAAAARSACGR